MAPTKANRLTNEIAILGRLLGNGPKMNADLARHVLGLAFSRADVARMNDLAARNQAGALSGAEAKVLHAYANAGCLLGILQSKARQALKKPGKSRAS